MLFFIDKNESKLIVVLTIICEDFMPQNYSVYVRHFILLLLLVYLCRYQDSSVDKIVTVTNKNCTDCFNNTWENSEKDKEKKPAPTPCVSSPFVPAKKQKLTSEKYQQVYLLSLSLLL